MNDANVTMSNVATWDKDAVDEFLRKNRIYGCSTVIYENNIDGKGFLNLDLTSLTNFGLIFMERCKINALLNNIAPESERKEFIRRLVCQRKTSITNPPSKTEKPTSSSSSFPPMPHKPPNQRPNATNQMPPPAINSTLPIQKSISSPPPVPQKPPYLRPNMPPPEINFTPPIQKNKPPPPPNKPRSLVKSSEFSVEDDHYESLKPDYGACVDDWDEFSSGEFSDCEEEPGPMNAEHPDHTRIDEHLPTSDGSSVSARIDNAFSKFTSSFKRGSLLANGRVSKRQSGASSTPPPLPYRHGSSASLNSDRSESTSSVGKVPFPPLPDPPQPPKNRLVKNYPVSTPSSVAQRTSSPARPTARKEDLTPTKPWYFDVGRRDAERALKQCIEGAFLVRPTQHGEKGHRYTMSIIFNRRVFHIPVRQKSDGRWALGSEKPDEETFQSVEELVDEHRMKPINLHTDHRLVGTTCLMIWPSGQSF